MARRRLAPPSRGVSDKAPFVDQPGDTCPPDAMLNVRPFSGASGRVRYGPRPSVVRLFDTHLGGPIQSLKVVSRASGISGHEIGTSTRVTTGTSLAAGTLSGHGWVLDSVYGLKADFYDGTGTPAAAYACAWHPDNTKAAIVTIFGTSSRVSMWNVASKTSLWATSLIDRDAGSTTTGTQGIYANNVLVTTVYTYVVASQYVYIFKTSDGTYIYRHRLLSWAQEAMDIKQLSDGKIVVLFTGTPSIQGPVTTRVAVQATPYPPGAPLDGEGKDFRSGILLFEVSAASPAVATDPFTVVQFGVKKTAAYTYYEDHPYFRVSEHSRFAPRGAIVNSMEVDSEDSIFVARCNRGWGPTSAFVPDTSTDRVAVFKISKGAAGYSDAYMVWEADFGSRLDPYIGPWGTTVNDRPVPVGAIANDPNTDSNPHPSADAICVDLNGDVYVGGRAEDEHYSLFKLRGTDGQLMWRRKAGYDATTLQSISQHALTWNPVTNEVVAATVRANNYDGVVGAAYAHLVGFDSISGDTKHAYSFENAAVATTKVAATMVKSNSNGDLLYTTFNVT